MVTSRIDRRVFLRASGVAIALPMLDAMRPLTALAQQQTETTSPRRMVLVGRPFALHGPHFFPEQAGPNYVPSRYLRELEPNRGNFTVFSGMSHRGYPNGHHTSAALMTGVHPDGVRSVRDIQNTISLDQEVAARIGGATRFGSLVLGGGEMSWNRRGVKVPSQNFATSAFRQLFIQGTADEQARELRRIQDGRSILDGVREQTAALVRTVGAADRQRLDLFLTSLREAEQRLQQDEAWVHRPKPRVEYPLPADNFMNGRLIEKSRQWYDIVHLALQTDSTRVVSLALESQERPAVDGVSLTHHDASHHGQDEFKIEQLALIEQAEIRALNDFLAKLKATTEGDHSLLDRTMVLFASNLGNASAHSVDNLPILLAGGGFRHQGHIAYDRRDNAQFANLFVRMLQQMDIELSSFGASTGVNSDV